MNAQSNAVLLIAHGSPATDIPRSMLATLRQLRGLKEPSAEEVARADEQEEKIRNWPRTANNDPYQEGTEALVEALRKQLGTTPVVAAYNEFCAPSTEQAVAQLAASGVTHISVFSTMMTPGGGHSERDIPEALAQCRKKFPGVELEYVWPYDLNLVASVIGAQLKRLQTSH